MLHKYHYKLENQNLELDSKIALISDIHFSKTFDIKLFRKILDNIKIEQPDYICIPGDTVDEVLVTYTSAINILIQFIKDLGTIAPTFISLGNHDYMYRQKNKHMHKHIYRKNNTFLEKINKISNVYILDNEAISINDINFIGCTLPFQYYYGKSYEDENEFQKVLPNIMGNVDKTKYNVLLIHSPSIIARKKYIDKLSNISLILCGHMHNGLVPNFIHFKNFGIIGPKWQLFPKYARGIIQRKDMYIVIGSGLVKFSDVSPKILHPLNMLYPYEIEYITIKKKIIDGP